MKNEGTGSGREARTAAVIGAEGDGRKDAAGRAGDELQEALSNAAFLESRPDRNDYAARAIITLAAAVRRLDQACEGYFDTIARLQAEVQARSSPAPDGWRLVPVEATPEMERAFYKSVLHEAITRDGGAFAKRYVAMLAASPTPAVQPPQPAPPEVELLRDWTFTKVPEGYIVEHRDGSSVFVTHDPSAHHGGISAAMLCKLAAHIDAALSAHRPPVGHRPVVEHQGLQVLSGEASWRSIESAPRNKTRVVLAHFSGNYRHYGTGYWMPLEGWRGWYGDEPNMAPPTHWMPLPEPPK